MMSVRTIPASRFETAAGDAVPLALGSLSSADTLDVLPSAIQSASDAQNRHVGFIEGSSPHIAGEIANILRGRLRAAAGILGLSFGLFFLYRLITVEGPALSDSLTFYFHFLVSVVLIVCFGLLCR